MYDEFGPGMNLPSMRDAFQSERYPGQDMIVKYLRENGKVHMACPGISRDKITGERLTVEMTHMDDGVYSWTSSLAYYVDKYNLRLPEEFESHVRRHMAT